MDTPIDIDSSWYGHSFVGGGQRVIVSDVKGQNYIYNRPVQFTPLKSSDEGTYFFSVRIRSLYSEYLLSSSFVNDSIDISPSKYTTYTITVFMDMRIIRNFCYFGTCDELCKCYIL